MHLFTHTHTYTYTYIQDISTERGLQPDAGHIHTYTHECIHTCTHKQMRSILHTHLHTCMHAYIHARIHPYTDVGGREEPSVHEASEAWGPENVNTGQSKCTRHGSVEKPGTKAGNQKLGTKAGNQSREPKHRGRPAKRSTPEKLKNRECEFLDTGQQTQIFQRTCQYFLT